jgi:hypothetical protein
VRSHFERRFIAVQRTKQRIRLLPPAEGNAHAGAAPGKSVRLRGRLTRLGEAVPDAARLGKLSLIEEPDRIAKLCDYGGFLLHVSLVEAGIGWYWPGAWWAVFGGKGDHLAEWCHWLLRRRMPEGP